MIPLSASLVRALEPLRGKVLRLDIAGLPLRPQVTLAGSCLVPVPFGAADVTVRASLGAFAALALRREDADRLFFSRRLVLEGDTALGLALRNALEAR